LQVKTCISAVRPRTGVHCWQTLRNDAGIRPESWDVVDEEMSLRVSQYVVQASCPFGRSLQ
jgi:hypothetical protein